MLYGIRPDEQRRLAGDGLHGAGLRALRHRVVRLPDAPARRAPGQPGVLRPRADLPRSPIGRTADPARRADGLYCPREMVAGDERAGPAVAALDRPSAVRRRADCCAPRRSARRRSSCSAADPTAAGAASTATRPRAPGRAPSPAPGDRDRRSPRPGCASGSSAALDRPGARRCSPATRRRFLAVADPAGPATAALRRQYASLRGAAGRPVATGSVSTAPTRQADGAVAGAGPASSTASATPSCIARAGDDRHAAGPTRPAGVRLVAVEPSLSTADGPRPWEVDELVRAAPASGWSSRRRRGTAPRPAPACSREAERAATVADRYAVGGRRPARYLVFFAGPAEWKRWYGGEPPGLDGRLRGAGRRRRPRRRHQRGGAAPHAASTTCCATR